MDKPSMPSCGCSISVCSVSSADCDGCKKSTFLCSFAYAKITMDVPHARYSCHLHGHSEILPDAPPLFVLLTANTYVKGNMLALIGVVPQLLAFA